MKKLSILFIFSSVFLFGCWPKYPGPIEQALGGDCEWIRTVETKTGRIIESTNIDNTKILSIVKGDNKDSYHYKIVFYTNGVPTDSLFRETWKTDLLNKDETKVAYRYVDKDGNPVTVFYHYHFEKGKGYPWAFDMNIQRNAQFYNPKNDSLRMFYRLP